MTRPRKAASTKKLGLCWLAVLGDWLGSCRVGAEYMVISKRSTYFEICNSPTMSETGFGYTAIF